MNLPSRGRSGQRVTMTIAWCPAAFLSLMSPVSRRGRPASGRSPRGADVRVVLADEGRLPAFGEHALFSEHEVSSQPDVSLSSAAASPLPSVGTPRREPVQIPGFDAFLLTVARRAAHSTGCEPARSMLLSGAMIMIGDVRPRQLLDRHLPRREAPTENGRHGKADKHAAMPRHRRLWRPHQPGRARTPRVPGHDAHPSGSSRQPPRPRRDHPPHPPTPRYRQAAGRPANGASPLAASTQRGCLLLAKPRIAARSPPLATPTVIER